jgi:hypothetical protein
MKWHMVAHLYGRRVVQYFVNISASLAASALFWLIIQQIPSLGVPLQISGMIVVFAVCVAFGMWWSRKRAGKDTNVGSHSEFQKGLDATLEDTVVSSNGGSTNVFSGNKIGGKATVTIKNSEIKS